MRKLKTILTLVVIATVVAVGVAALFWRQLLTPEQKLRYGLTFDAAADLQQAAAANADDKAALDRYVGVLVREGNLGRAFELIDLYGAQNPGPGEPDLAPLRDLLKRSINEVRGTAVVDLTADPAAEPFAEDPLKEVLRYLEGYRHASLGDWASARNQFAAIEVKKLPPALRPYHLYYLARAYRLGGSPEEKAQVEELYGELFEVGHPGLVARGRYNLLAHYLSDSYPGIDGVRKAEALRRQIGATTRAELWAAQKSDGDFAQYYWDAKDIQGAWTYAFDSVRRAPADRAGETAGQLLLVLARTLSTKRFPDASPLEQGLDAAGKLTLPLPEGSLEAWATNGAAFGYGQFVLRELAALSPRLPASSYADSFRAQALLLAQLGNAAGLRELLAAPAYRGLPADVRAEGYLQLGGVLQANEQWNAALAELRQVTSGPRVADALFARYTILKEVQEPLDLNAAQQLLMQIVDDHPGSKAAVRTVEELIPLLVYRGSRGPAQELAQLIAFDDFGGPERQGSPEDYDKLQGVGDFWLAYFGVAEHKAQAFPRYWTYYELAPRQGLPAAEAASPHALVAAPATAGEYLAGLGLIDEAEQYYNDIADTFEQSNQNQPAADFDQVLVFNKLRLWRELQSESGAQYQATELLEAGGLKEAGPLLDYALDIAYPTPFSDEVRKAVAETNIDAALIYAVIKKESNFKPENESGVGAQGLMQLMPYTADLLANTRGIPRHPITNPEVNIRLGAAYLDSLRTQLAGQTAPAGPQWAHGSHSSIDPGLLRAILHSYNGGPGNYAKWRGNYPGADAVLLADLLPNEENEAFAKRVWKFYQIYSWRLNP